jgi:hypothetical protein
VGLFFCGLLSVDGSYKTVISEKCRVAKYNGSISMADSTTLRDWTPSVEISHEQSGNPGLLKDVTRLDHRRGAFTRLAGPGAVRPGSRGTQDAKVKRYGFPDGDVGVVRDNARQLKFKPESTAALSPGEAAEIIGLALDPRFGGPSGARRRGY